MTFEQEFIVAEQWTSKVSSPEQLIRCLPGIEDLSENADGSFHIRLKTGIGPIRLSFDGVALVERPESARWTADVTLRERMAGKVYGQFTLFQRDRQYLVIHAEISLEGRLAEFAQVLLKKRAADMVMEFQHNFLALVG